MYAGGMTITSSSQRREIVYTHRIERENCDVTLSTVEHTTITTKNILDSKQMIFFGENFPREIHLFSILEYSFILSISLFALEIVVITFSSSREISSLNERAQQ